ncbi:MAG TPA: MFS transporter [Devosiaceae bacterium]|nr:MFS transporter [Devosiaceae bacterium]
MSVAIANSVPAAHGDRDDLRTIGLVGLAHFNSHFLLLALAPLLPLIKTEFDVSFTQLGFLLTLFFATSGAGQVVAGVLVDRFGSHRLLLSGMALQAVSVVAMGFAPSFVYLIPLTFFAGIGNTVYHPSDLSILSRRVSRKRQGRAFATHAMAGSLGFALSPIAVGLAAAAWGWRAALFGAGVLGLAIALTMLVNRSALRADEVPPQAASETERTEGPAPRMGFLQILAMPVVLFGFGFFFLSTLALAGLMNFTVSALTEPHYGVTLALATLAAAVVQFGAVGGTLAGGVVADRLGHHDRIAIAGCVGAAILVLPVAHAGLPLWLIVVLLLLVGVSYGATLPSRDMLIRQSAPRGNLGKTFGTVYSGLDAGSLVGPLIIGPMLDIGAPQWLFVMAAASLLLATFTVAGIRATGGAAAR